MEKKIINKIKRIRRKPKRLGKRPNRTIVKDDFIISPKPKDIDPGGDLTQFRKLPKNVMLQRMKAYKAHVLDRYLVGLVHPDIAVQQGLGPKLYNDLPIPTGTMGYKIIVNATTNATGNMLIGVRAGFPTWNGTQRASYITVNNASGLNGTSNVAGNSFVPCGPTYGGGSFQKYRLVSQLTRVVYNDVMLNLAGKYHACCTYEPLSIALEPTTAADTLLDRYGDFTVIQNGLWNKTLNISNTDQAIEVLWVPSDARDTHFAVTGTYYGTSVAATNTAYQPSSDGAHMNYVIAVQGAPASSKFIIEVFVNYEVIADPTAAPYLNQNSEIAWTTKDTDKYKKVVNDQINGSGLIRPSTRQLGSNNWMDTIFSAANHAAPLIKQLLSLF